MGAKPRRASHSSFWSIVSASRADSDPSSAEGNQARQLALLERLLERETADGRIAFAREFSRHFWRAYRWDLWDAAYVVGGGCSDDGFTDFRSWLISMGEEVFEAALAAPRSLAAAALSSGVEYAGFEEFAYVVANVHRRLSGEELPSFTEHHRASPSGTRSASEEEREARFPELAKRVAELESQSPGSATTDDDPEGALHRAAARFDLEGVTSLLAAGADANAVDHAGRTPLAEVAANLPDERAPALVALLAAHGADPNIADFNGCTPLIFAASEGETAVAKALLEAGADVTLRHNDGDSALDCARDSDTPELVALLERAQAG